MMLSTTQLGSRTGLVSSRATTATTAMWHRGANAINPTVGAACKPFDQRPKEDLL